MSWCPDGCRAEVMCGASPAVPVGRMAPQTSLMYFQMCQMAWSLLVTVFRQVNKVLYLRRDGLPWKGERPPQGCWSFAYSHKSCPAGLLPLPAELITRTSPTANKPCRSPKVGTHPAIPPGTGSVSCQRVTHFSSCCQVRSALRQPRGFEPCPCPKKW